MEQRQFGNTDMQVGVLGFGGAEIGFEKADAETVSKMLNSALDRGLNVIDTAECYLDSEELIGKTVSHRRSDYWLFTKCGHPVTPDVGDWRPDSLIASIERSVQRLKTETIDLVQLHSCTLERLQQGDVIAALQTARQRGLCRYIGYAGDAAAAKYAIDCGAFDSLQTSVSLLDQEAIDLTLEQAKSAGMGIIAKRPVANVVWKFPDGPTNPYLKPYWERMKRLDYQFLKGDVDAGVSTALRFTLAAPGVCVAIVGTAKPDRWLSNLKLLDAGPMPAAEFAAIHDRWRDVAGADWTGRT